MPVSILLTDSEGTLYDDSATIELRSTAASRVATIVVGVGAVAQGVERGPLSGAHPSAAVGLEGALVGVEGRVNPRPRRERGEDGAGDVRAHHMARTAP